MYDLTLCAGTYDPDRVFIRTEDLRAQCKSVSGEQEPESHGSNRSPKKKLFGVTLPNFSRASDTSTTPAMPHKAAQVLGATPPSKPRRIQSRPIRSAQVSGTPTKMPKPDVGKPLAAKVHGRSESKSNHSNTTRGSRRSECRTPEKENTPPREQPSSVESTPPTPPAKDTPPNFPLPTTTVNPPSPLHRAPSYEDLRECYGALSGKEERAELPFPKFALSPSPPKTALLGTGGEDPVKFRPYNADDYTKLIEGEALQWLHTDEDATCEGKEGNHSAPLAETGNNELQLPQSSRSDELHYNDKLSLRLSPIPPRFYSPSDRSFQLNDNGESPSQNVSEALPLESQHRLE